MTRPSGWPERWSETAFACLGITYSVGLDSYRVEHTDTKLSGYGATAQDAYEDLCTKMVALAAMRPDDQLPGPGKSDGQCLPVFWSLEKGQWRLYIKGSDDLPPEKPADKPYTVWRDGGSSGWSPSEPLATLDDCFAHLRDHGHIGDFRITREVTYEIRVPGGLVLTVTDVDGSYATVALSAAHCRDLARWLLRTTGASLWQRLQAALR